MDFLLVPVTGFQPRLKATQRGVYDQHAMRPGKRQPPRCYLFTSVSGREILGGSNA